MYRALVSFIIIVVLLGILFINIIVYLLPFIVRAVIIGAIIGLVSPKKQHTSESYIYENEEPSREPENPNVIDVEYEVVDEEVKK